MTNGYNLMMYNLIVSFFQKINYLLTYLQQNYKLKIKDKNKIKSKTKHIKAIQFNFGAFVAQANSYT